MFLTNFSRDKLPQRAIIQHILPIISPCSDAHICFEITQINASSFSDLCVYLWCCVASASKREGKPFDYTLMDFADSLSPEDMEEWSKAITTDAGTEGGKKKVTG